MQGWSPVQDEKTPAVVTHVLGLLTLFVGPLVMYFIFKGRASPWLRAHLDEAVNYHIWVVLAVVSLTTLALVLTEFGFAGVALFCLFLLLAVVVANLLFSITAIVRAGQGETYHFPLDVAILR